LKLYIVIKSQSGYFEDAQHESSGRSDSKNSRGNNSTKNVHKVMQAMRRPSLFVRKEHQKTSENKLVASHSTISRKAESLTPKESGFRNQASAPASKLDNSGATGRRKKSRDSRDCSGEEIKLKDEDSFQTGSSFSSE
jgi:hypothetical protein